MIGFPFPPFKRNLIWHTLMTKSLRNVVHFINSFRNCAFLHCQFPHLENVLTFRRSFKTQTVRICRTVAITVLTENIYEKISYAVCDKYSKFTITQEFKQY